MAQVDVHFSMTFAVAQRAGRKDAKIIAFSNYQTDKHKPTFGSHTQVNGLSWMWSWAGVYFHFTPGDIIRTPLVTTANNRCVQALVEKATNPFELGLALHTLQDSFNHQNFSGRTNKINSCFTEKAWYRRLIPDYGHSDMMTMPDITTAQWFDPRIEQNISNIHRTQLSIIATGKALGLDLSVPDDLFHPVTVDQRERRMRLWSGSLRFEDIAEPFWRKYRKEWLAAARRQVEIVKTFLS